MKVQHLLEFIRELHEEVIQAKCDASILHAIHSRFKELNPENRLNEDDIGFIVKCYASRWEKVQGKEHDYTLSDFNIDQQWVNFAKTLSAETKIPYLKILMPTITNEHDPHDNSALTETSTMTNFYLANGGTILCRKRSLCDYLLDHKFELVTGKGSKKGIVFTLDELSCLQRCRVYSPFAIQSDIQTEHFSSFWDFMKKKVFVRLSEYDDLPEGLLPHLLELIECYYALKASNKDFNEFKNSTKSFFKRLYSYDFKKINALYGQQVFYHNKNHYLLDVFITIFDATEFNLEHEMEVIAKLLFNIHPVLKANIHELKSCYLEPTTRFSTTSAKKAQIEAYLKCCSLLISLYVTKFQFGFIFSNGVEISAWDKKNEIPEEFYDIYTSLIKAFNSEKLNYVDVFKQIVETNVTEKTADTTYWTRISRDKTAYEWLCKVKDNSLMDVGGYWFPPELIISALFTFSTTRVEIKKLITNFLDELVNTYAQNHGDFIKEVRVNILFSQFLCQLSDSQRRNLIMLMTLFNEKPASEIKSTFLNNCALHINNRLAEFGYRQYQKAPNFYLREPNCKITQDFVGNETNVLTVLENYSTKLPLEHLDVEIQERIRRYLFNLKNPILSIEEINESRRDCETTSDPLGQPS